MTVVDDVTQQRFNNMIEHGGAEHDDHHTPEEWILFIDHQIYLCEEVNAYSDFRDRMVNIAAVAMDAIASYDRTHKES